MWKKGHGARSGSKLVVLMGLSLQEAYESVVEYFGENPKTTSPSVFFPLFSRFTKAYKVQVSDGPLPDSRGRSGDHFRPR